MIKWFMDAVRRAQKNLSLWLSYCSSARHWLHPQRVWRKTLVQLQQPARPFRARLLRSQKAHS
jgi:hypothetical protein